MDMTSTVEMPNITAERQNGVLSFQQIKDIVGDGWAVIKDPVFNGCIFKSGQLYFYSHNEDEAMKILGSSKEKHLYFKFCGDPDPNIVYLL